MARSLLARGVDAVTVKLVQTGCAGGVADDLARHRAISGAAPCYEDTLGITSPQIFAFPASPELAARREGKKVDLRRILMCIQACAAHHDVVLVEGAGGLAVPLADDLLAIDLAARQKWPLILVTSGRLGSINHTLLSLEAAKRRRMKIAGIVYNWTPDADPVIDDDTPRAIQNFSARLQIDAPLVRVPELSRAGDLDFTPFFS